MSTGLDIETSEVDWTSLGLDDLYLGFFSPRLLGRFPKSTPKDKFFLLSPATGQG